MICIKDDIESYRSISQIFTPSNFSRIIRNREWKLTKGKIKKHVLIDSSISNLDLFRYLYQQLQDNYRTEYLYKNAILNKLLLGKYSLNTTTIINEFKVGGSIADIVLLNGDAKIFEIKTEYDSLDKLKKQLEDYQRFANEVYVVTSTKHIARLLKEYKNSNIGLIEFTQRNTLKEIQPAKANSAVFDHDIIFRSLRKPEYLDIINEYFGYIPDVPNTKIFKISYELTRAIDLVSFQKLAYRKLKERKQKCPEQLISIKTPYELRHICYSLNMNKKEYNTLHDFLIQKA